MKKVLIMILAVAMCCSLTAPVCANTIDASPSVPPGSSSPVTIERVSLDTDIAEPSDTIKVSAKIDCSEGDISRVLAYFRKLPSSQKTGLYSSTDGDLDWQPPAVIPDFDVELDQINGDVFYSYYTIPEDQACTTYYLCYVQVWYDNDFDTFWEYEDGAKPYNPLPNYLRLRIVPKGTKGGSSRQSRADKNSSESTLATPVQRTLSQQALRQILQNGEGPYKLSNYTSLPLSVLKQAGTATLYADTRTGGKILGRMYLNAAEATMDVNPTIRLLANTAPVKANFTHAQSVKLDQVGSFGMNVEVAVKVPLENLKAENLRIFYYQNGAYTLLENADAYVDVNGFTHFKTDKGGAYIISD